MKKVIRAAFASAIVLAVIAAGAVSLSLGRIVKTAVEAAGPRVLGAPVTLQFAAISPFTGKGALRGLVIGNPEGFKTPRAVSVGSVEIAVKLSSLLTHEIVVDSVVVRKPEIVWELGPGGASNLTRLQKNAESAAASLGAQPDAASKSSRSLLIRDLQVTGGVVGLSATAFGGGALSAPLPDVHLTNLGGEGRSPAAVASEAFQAVTSAAQRGVSNIGSRTLDAAASAARSALSALFRKGGK
ncbi:MAG: AsmA family protein [Elusimicrobia bacterium]|nr:AsmA family protein [Elusimicrobiota bacterium]